MSQRWRSVPKAFLLVVAAASLAACGAPGGGAGSPPPAAKPSVADLIGVPGPLALDGIDHTLAWSNQPKPDYYQQEYLPAGQEPDSYQRMMQVELVGGAAVADALKAQIAVLDQRKKTDPVVNYNVRLKQETGEALLDFVLAGKSSTGEDLIEWNVYRYSPVPQTGKKGTQLYSLSLRAYGKDREDFLRNLKQTRPKEINAVAAAQVPKVAVPA